MQNQLDRETTVLKILNTKSLAKLSHFSKNIIVSFNKSWGRGGMVDTLR